MTLILLATHNGRQHLPDQLASLADQTDTDWRLLVQDDCSTDGTCSLLEHSARTDPRIVLLSADGPRRGPSGNFGRLMGEAMLRDESRIAFCDQDDVWLPQKLERQASTLSALERLHGASTPLLVHSDLEVVNRKLEQIHPSLMRFQLINRPDDAPPLTLLAQNHVVGCTMMMNRALLALATPVPDDVHMHDWWVALCAEFAGVRRYIDEPLAQYRQHGDNSVGAQGVKGRLSRPWLLFDWVRKMNNIYRSTWKQAARLSERLQQRGVDVRHRELLQRFLALRSSSRPLRSWHLINMGVRSQNALMSALYHGQSMFLRLDPDADAGVYPCKR